MEGIAGARRGRLVGEDVDVGPACLGAETQIIGESKVRVRGWGRGGARAKFISQHGRCRDTLTWLSSLCRTRF